MISENVEVYLPAYNVWAKDHDEPTYTAISEDNIPDMGLSDLIKVFAAAIADETEGEYLSSDNEVLTEEEVAAIIECVMPELRTLASARLFELRNIDHIDHIDVSSRPFAPDYSGKIESDEEIGLIMSSLFDLHALETAGESLYGMAWVLDIYYRDDMTPVIQQMLGNRIITKIN